MGAGCCCWPPAAAAAASFVGANRTPEVGAAAAAAAAAVSMPLCPVLFVRMMDEVCRAHHSQQQSAASKKRRRLLVHARSRARAGPPPRIFTWLMVGLTPLLHDVRPCAGVLFHILCFGPVVLCVWASRRRQRSLLARMMTVCALHNTARHSRPSRDVEAIQHVFITRYSSESLVVLSVCGRGLPLPKKGHRHTPCCWAGSYGSGCRCGGCAAQLFQPGASLRGERGCVFTVTFFR
jgi:hypothetical protein